MQSFSKCPCERNPVSLDHDIDVEILLHAYAMGRQSTLDVLRWDPWSEIHRPVEALRQQYQIKGMRPPRV